MIKLHTNFGVISVELEAEKAPKTAQNFIDYVSAGHYDNTIFHRVIDGFMIQGGGFDPSMKQKATRGPIDNEAGLAMKGGLKNEVGTVAMARTSDPHSATAQFFINLKDNGFLDFRGPYPEGFGYAVFGRVTQGMDTVLRIAKVPTATVGPFQNVPQKPVVIESVTVVKSGK